MIYAFVRSPSWSVRTAIFRLETKLRRVRERAAAVAYQLGVLQAEAVASAAFERDLMERLAVERRKADGVRSGGFPHSDVVYGAIAPSPPEVKVGDSAPDPIVRSMSVHTGSRRYDSSMKVFSPVVPNVGGSHQPVRPTLTSDASADADIVRLLSVLETPGLMHFMVMSEKAQSECHVEDVAVAKAALGLPLSEAFIDSVFSVEIIPILADPIEAVGHLAKVAAASQSRGAF